MKSWKAVLAGAAGAAGAAVLAGCATGPYYGDYGYGYNGYGYGYDGAYYGPAYVAPSVGVGIGYVDRGDYRREWRGDHRDRDGRHDGRGDRYGRGDRDGRDPAWRNERGEPAWTREQRMERYQQRTPSGEREGGSGG